MKRAQPKFEVVLVEAVQEGLDSISPSCTDIVLFHLQKHTVIRTDKPNIDPEAFDDCLKEIFGFGAKVIEKKILERLFSKLEAPRKIDCGFKFAEEVERAQRLLSSSAVLVAKATH